MDGSAPRAPGQPSASGQARWVRALGAKRQDAGVAAPESRRKRGGRSVVSLTLAYFHQGFTLGCWNAPFGIGHTMELRVFVGRMVLVAD